MSFAESIVQNKFANKFLYNRKIGLARDLKLVNSIAPYLKGKTKILDIGSGLGRIAKLLENKGYDVTAVDIQNLSITEGIKPVIYDGKKLPFKITALTPRCF